MARRRARGLALAEALVAVAILALMGGLMFGTFARAMDARERATAITDRAHQVRQAMLRMSREISAAFISTHRDCVEPRTNTLFAAQRASFGARLDFTSFSHLKMRADAKESDQNELSYFVEVDPEDHARRHLMRREQGRIDEKPAEGGVVQVLAEDVDALDFEFYDPKTDHWEDDWDSNRLDTRYRLPKYVRIKLTVHDGGQKPQVFETKTRVFLQTAINIPGLGAAPCPE